MYRMACCLKALFLETHLSLGLTRAFTSISKSLCYLQAVARLQ